jgi:hypothetical protein
VEVSCSHGGAASYLTRTFHPLSYTGLDLSPAGITFCRKRHNVAGLSFVEGDAGNLPSSDISFDAVINVEAGIILRCNSFHTDGSMGRFGGDVAVIGCTASPTRDPALDDLAGEFEIGQCLGRQLPQAGLRIL